MTTLYRADGGASTGGVSSWTSSRSHAEEYRSGRFSGFGGKRLITCRVDETASDVLDLRAGARAALAAAELVDLDDYGCEPLQDLVRSLAALFRAHGYLWVAFRERLEHGYDEWLCLSTE